MATQRQDEPWFCPLLKAEIAEGRCLDIQYERHRFMKVGALAAVERWTGASATQVHATCDGCPRLPFRIEDLRIEFPRGSERGSERDARPLDF
ncbi:MAG: hypothetical protein JNM84_18425 [Planctomycetes bacterium]|nr:hypothetical protein [Planctomycetota bacterium]